MARYCFAQSQIEDMGARHKAGDPAYVIAAAYGCSPQTIIRTLQVHDLWDAEIRYNKRSTVDQKEQMVRRYVGGESLRSIAHDFGCTPGNVRYILLAREVEMRPMGRPAMSEETLGWIREQRECGRTYASIAKALGVTPYTIQVTCRDRLRMGPDRRASGPQHHAWKGGRRVDGNGYVQVHVPVDDPMYAMATSLGYVPEHRLVMARSLGRALTSKETVHHINGDKMDNDLGNLQLRQGNHGKGSVMACLDCGSHNVGHVPIK